MNAPPLPGTARIMQGDSNSLTQFNDNAVVGLGQEREWRIRPVGIGHPNSVIIILKSDGGEEKCLTLDPNSGDSDEINILVMPLESPPRPEQAWTVEDAILQPSMPPIVHGRMQSVARRHLSAAIGGAVPLPRIFMNVAAVPHADGDMERFRWRMNYTDMQD